MPAKHRDGRRKYYDIALLSDLCLADFTVTHFEKHYERAYEEFLTLCKQERLKVPFHIEEGIDNFPLALQKLFTGGHTGKRMLKI